jgi:hypothetical protein
VLYRDEIIPHAALRTNVNSFARFADTQFWLHQTDPARKPLVGDPIFQERIVGVRGFQGVLQEEEVAPFP